MNNYTTSAYAKSNRSTSGFQSKQQPNEILFQTFHQNSKIQSVDLSEKLDLLLQDNQALNQRLSKQIEDSQIISQSNCTLGINFDQLFLRMETLENLIEQQHQQITFLKQQNINTEKQDNLIASFIDKNAVYQEMIFQQQQEIENYRRIVEINANLQKENGTLQKRIKQLESLVEEYQFYKIEIENKVYDVIELNKNLQEQIEQQMVSQQQEEYMSQKHYQKDQEIKTLISVANNLKNNIKAIEEKNSQSRARDLKFSEIKQQIQSQRTTPSWQFIYYQQISDSQLNFKGTPQISFSFQNNLTERNYTTRGIDLNDTLKKITNVQARLIQRQ